MALTDRLQIVVDCFPNGKPDLDRREFANKELFEIVGYSKSFPIVASNRK